VNISSGVCARVSIGRTNGQITVAWGGGTGLVSPGFGQNSPAIYAQYFKLDPNSQYGVDQQSGSFAVVSPSLQGYYGATYIFGDVDSDTNGNPVIAYIRQQAQNQPPLPMGAWFQVFNWNSISPSVGETGYAFSANYGSVMVARYGGGDILLGWSLQNTATVRHYSWSGGITGYTTISTNVVVGFGDGGLACQRNTPGSWVLGGGGNGGETWSYQVAVADQPGSLVTINQATATYSAAADNYGNFIFDNSNLNQVGNYPQQ
jgi:hypothetical protein